MQVVELIILAALAGVVLFQLYAVLGRRVGRGPQDLPAPQTAPGGREAQRPLSPPTEETVALSGIAALRARDPNFDVAVFVQGAKSAYQMIVKAYAAADRATLKPLLSPAVMAGFETAMDEHAAQGLTQSVEFLQPPRADFEGVNVSGDMAKASVRFLAEYRRRSKGPEGEAVEDERAAEIWTFERNLKSRDPNWTLIHVDAAEA